VTIIVNARGWMARIASLGADHTSPVPQHYGTAQGDSLDCEYCDANTGKEWRRQSERIFRPIAGNRARRDSVIIHFSPVMLPSMG